MLSVKEAQKKVLECSIRIKAVKVPLLDSLGLILAEDVISKDDIPVYNNSAMDGYAAKSISINHPIEDFITCSFGHELFSLKGFLPSLYTTLVISRELWMVFNCLD